MKSTLIKQSGTKLRSTPALVTAITAEFKKGTKLPAAVKVFNKTTGQSTVHLVSPVYWTLEADAAGSLAATKAAVVAARKSGQRREVVARRANISVKAVAAFEGDAPVYTGRGTRKHVGGKPAPAKATTSKTRKSTKKGK